MVSFQAIATALSHNAHAAFQVATYRVRPQPIVGSFKLPTIRIEPTVIPVLKRSREPLREALREPSPVRSEASEEALPPPTRIMPTKPIVSPTPPTPPTSPTPPAPPTPPREMPERRARFTDPICLGIERVDAMYAIATANVQRALECEEARRLEGRIGELYKT